MLNHFGALKGWHVHNAHLQNIQFIDYLFSYRADGTMKSNENRVENKQISGVNTIAAFETRKQLPRGQKAFSEV